MEFKEWCGQFPLDTKQVAANIPFFTKLTYKILVYLESVPPLEDGKCRRGLKLFAMAPLKSDYVQDNITINPTTLCDLLASMTPQSRCDLLHGMDIADIECREGVIKTLQKEKNYTMTMDMLQEKEFHRVLFELIFDTKPYERKGMVFANSIKTNGYAVCLGFDKAPKRKS